MRREIVQDFLNVPGIVGIALMDGLSSPYFRGFELRHQGMFEPDQQVTVAQSIQQVLETTPEGFNAFEFQFDFHRVYLHKLNQGIMLLVLTGNQVSGQSYTQAVRRLLIELQIDQANPVAEFRALALDIPLPPALPLVPIESLLSYLSVEPLIRALPPASQQSASQQSASQQSSKTPQRAIQPEKATELAKPPLEQPPELPSRQMRLVPAPQVPEIHSADSATLPSGDLLLSGDRSANVGQAELKADLNPVDLKDMLSAINRLSQLTTRYLGTMIVSNYWKATRPPLDWLNHFQVERSAQMTFSVQMPSEPLPILTAEQYQCLQDWVAAFIERCSRVIREFARLVHQTLTQQQIVLLFGCNRA